MIKRLCFVFILIASAVMASDSGDLDKRLAVLPFDGKMIEDEYAETLSSLLRNELGSLEGYEVIDRSNMEMILKEQKIQLHDCTDSSCAVRFGEILNVRWMVVGSLSKFGKKYLFITRRVDVQTGRIIKTSQFESTTLEALTDAIPEVARELLGLKSASGSNDISDKGSDQAKATTELPTLPPVVNQSGSSSSSVPPPVIRGGGEPPTIEWIAQPPGTMSLWDGKQVMFRWRGNDDRCIKVYHYRFNDEPMKETRRSQVVVENAGEGNHTFQVMVEDCDGNVSSPLRSDFTVRNMPPEVTIESPGEDETVHEKRLVVRLSGQDSDGSVAKYRCAVNNPSNPREQTSPDFSFDVADGPVMIYAQVVDDAGLDSSWTEKRVIFRYQTDPTPTPTPKPGDWANARHGKVKTVSLGNGVTLEMVYVKGGSFQMGSPSGESRRESDEGPVHSVILDGFWMGKYEVTQGQYQAMMGENPSSFKGSNRPVQQVSWNEAMEFCRKLSSRTGQTFTLPTEAQWEYACRAGSQTRFCFGDSDSGLGAYGWYSDNSGSETDDVGGKRANDWDLYDMHGNVWEWCLDWYDSDYYSKSSGRNPAGPGSGSLRVGRGSSWLNSARNCRSASRHRGAPDYRGNYLGFRVCLPGQSG